ncbi:MAG: acyltransferase [Bacteroidales bacterium]|nr:acyltransferase [Bacteroidales bacterium]
MRKHWIDNLRWVTVLLVLLYHVIYFYNNKGVFGGVGGFGDGPQYQDVLMYILYPWFMPLLFLLAGISARYSLEKHPAKEWFKSRTRKLLVPSTIGLFVFQWMTGYFNTLVARQSVLASMKQPALYFLWVVSGTGPLWFIQDLWLFSLVLLLIRRITPLPASKGKCAFSCKWASKASILWIVLLGILFWLGEQTLIRNPRPESADGLYNLYKPFFYLIPFLMGYYIFSRDGVQETVKKYWIPLMAGAVIAGIALIITTWGENNTTPEYLCSPLNCLYGWMMCLAMMGWFNARFDRTNAFAGYMTRTSFGIYITHYLIIAGLGSMMFFYTKLPPAAMYIILTIAVFTISPLLYEGLRRSPFLGWCIFGESMKQKK